MKKVRWETMLPDELLEEIERCPVCYMAYGLAEPHGPYNALGLDWLKAQGLLERAAREHGGVVAPPCCWHVQERPEFDWCGKNGVPQSLCSSIPPDLWLRMALYQIRAIDARGFRAAILITGHYGGVENDLRLLCECYMLRTRSPLRLFAAADWEVIALEGVGGDHAGRTETSQLMCLHPDLVDLSREVEGWPTGRWCGTQFSEDHPPSAEFGEKIVESQVERLGEIAGDLLSEAPSREDWQAPTLTDIEALWTRFESLTRRYWVMSQTWGEYCGGGGSKGLIPFPGWEALGEV